MAEWLDPSPGVQTGGTSTSKCHNGVSNTMERGTARRETDANLPQSSKKAAHTAAGKEFRSFTLPTSQPSQLDSCSDTPASPCCEEFFYCPECSDNSDCESCLDRESCPDCIECEDCDECNPTMATPERRYSIDEVSGDAFFDPTAYNYGAHMAPNSQAAHTMYAPLQGCSASPFPCNALYVDPASTYNPRPVQPPCPQACNARPSANYTLGVATPANYTLAVATPENYTLAVAAPENYALAVATPASYDGGPQTATGSTSKKCCDICGKGPFDASALAKHKNSDSCQRAAGREPVGKYQCPYCQKGRPRQDHVKRHILKVVRPDGSEKPPACEELRKLDETGLMQWEFETDPKTGAYRLHKEGRQTCRYKMPRNYKKWMQDCYGGRHGQ
jgi:hypothetical protein